MAYPMIRQPAVLFISTAPLFCVKDPFKAYLINFPFPSGLGTEAGSVTFRSWLVEEAILRYLGTRQTGLADDNLDTSGRNAVVVGRAWLYRASMGRALLSMSKV